ncbi:ABC transporter permease [Anaerosphaera multitolerans]|uniref:ABC transporter permease n=1 Tax=Anaerosphaera multitolerans TaxID=2487351 RepID=A0A437S8T9_9FIRM|nr:ABC transporter permease [Anaerosphaera multitolerans]RVU55248.1 ABC transporter permease [Anaerosphaera multitolerans]
MKSKSRLFYTIISILLGLIFGSVILLINGTNPIEAYKVIILGAVGKPNYISWTIVNSVPIILTGISVAFAFNTGLFNIGAEGQYIVGSIGAMLAGYFLKLPPIIHPIVALLCGALLGGLWGFIVGLLKSKFAVNEVISSIMLNWIGFYLSNYLLSFSSIRRPQSDNSYSILPSANIEFLKDWKVSESGIEFLSEHAIFKQLLRPPVNWGIVIAIIVAIIIWFILKKTTLGYQLKAVGFNKDAAEYGGININRSQIVSMSIAGFVSGLAGAITVLGVSGNIGMMASQQGYGFDGMAVSLIAGNNPLACIPAGLLFAGLNYGGGKLNSALGIYSEVIEIVIGVIILFVAMPKLLDLIGFIFKKKEGNKQ